MNELFLFVRPPRPLWPLNSPSSAFWPPLAFASMAAMLRERLPDLWVEILDAPALEMGWRTLTAEMQRRRPAFVGIGEEAVSCVEGLRLARLAKDCGAKVIAGGCFRPCRFRPGPGLRPLSRQAVQKGFKPGDQSRIGAVLVNLKGEPGLALHFAAEIFRDE